MSSLPTRPRPAPSPDMGLVMADERAEIAVVTRSLPRAVPVSAGRIQALLFLSASDTEAASWVWTNWLPRPARPELIRALEVDELRVAGRGWWRALRVPRARRCRLRAAVQQWGSLDLLDLAAIARERMVRLSATTSPREWGT